MYPLLRPLGRFQCLGVGLALSVGLFGQLSGPALRLDAAPILSTNSYARNAQAPLLRSKRLNPQVVRQISSGSIIGLCAGLLVSTFSKSLALLLGLLVVGAQWASSYGINVLPFNRLQKYVTSIDMRSAIQDNVAFKLSFGSTFALAAFLHF